ncbi:MAG: hypothetical protein QM742_10290 [Aquabacterium sp.]
MTATRGNHDLMVTFISTVVRTGTMVSTSTTVSRGNDVFMAACAVKGSTMRTAIA